MNRQADINSNGKEVNHINNDKTYGIKQNANENKAKRKGMTKDEEVFLHKMQ